MQIQNAAAFMGQSHIFCPNSRIDRSSIESASLLDRTQELHPQPFSMGLLIVNAEATKEEKQSLDLNLEVTEKSACERVVKVTIPEKDVERYFNKQFEELVPKAEVPGFRVGKAPRNLVESMFRKQVADQVKGSLLMDSLAQISETEDFSAISEPDIDFEQVSIPDKGDMEFTFHIEVRPEFDMPEWRGLELERPERDFTDQDIEERIQLISRNMSDVVPVDEAVQMDDLIICNITASHDGNVVSEAKEESITVKQSLNLADCVIEDFGKLVVGAEADQTVSTKVEISKYADNEDLQGKEVEIAFEILDVKRLEAKSTEDIAEKIGLGSVEELKELIQKSMEERLEYAQREKVRNQISSVLTKTADFDLPPDLLRRQSRRELERNAIELRSSGFSEEEITYRQNVLRQNILERTEVLLKEHFILERIAEEQDVEDAPEDYELEIARIAMQRNDSPRRVRAKLERTGQMDALRNLIIERKVIALITEQAKFTATEFSMNDEEESNSSAISFFAAGGSDNLIPEAKYDDKPEAKPLPTAKNS